MPRTSAMLKLISIASDKSPMKKKWSYLLFIPALFASYYMGTKSENAFKEDFKSKYSDSEGKGRSTSSVNKNKTVNEIKKELIKKKVEKIQARVKRREITEEDVNMPAMNTKSFVEKKQEELEGKVYDNEEGYNLKNADVDNDEEIDVASVLDDDDKQILRDLASEMPEAASELKEIFKDQKIKESDALKDSPNREKLDKEIAPLETNEY